MKIGSKVKKIRNVCDGCTKTSNLIGIKFPQVGDEATISGFEHGGSRVFLKEFGKFIGTRISYHIEDWQEIEDSSDDNTLEEIVEEKEVILSPVNRILKSLALIILLLFIGIMGFAQSKSTKVSIADEVAASTTEKYYTITCSNEVIAQELIRLDKHDPRMLRYRVNFKKDRLGRYAEYSFVYKLEDKEYVDGIFKELNKK